MDLASATVAQLMIPVADFDRGVSFYRDIPGIRFLFAAPPQMAFFMVAAPHVVNRAPKSELWLSQFTDPDGNQPALMAEIALADA